MSDIKSWGRQPIFQRWVRWERWVLERWERWVFFGQPIFPEPIFCLDRWERWVYAKDGKDGFERWERWVLTTQFFSRVHVFLKIEKKILLLLIFSRTSWLETHLSHLWNPSFEKPIFPIFKTHLSHLLENPSFLKPSFV